MMIPEPAFTSSLFPDIPPQVTARIVLPPALLLGLLYGLTSSENLSVAHDSAAYLLEIRDLPWDAWYPHHLLWHAAAALWAGLWPSGWDLVQRVVSLNVLAGTATLALAGCFLHRRLGLGSLDTRLGMMLAGGSYGLWCYSTVVEVYMLPLAGWMGLLLLLTGRLTPPRVLGLMVLHAAVILLHQSHILLIPAALWLLRSAPRLAVGYLGGLGMLTGGVYLAVLTGALQLDTPGEWLHWLIGYAHDDTYWQEPGLGMVIEPLVGFGRSLIGGHAAFRLLPVSAGTYGLADERFLVHALTPGAAAGLLAGTAVIGVWLLYGLIAGVRGWAWIPAPYRVHVRWLGGVWVSYALFFLAWMPVNPEFWLPQMLVFWLIFMRLYASTAWPSKPLRRKTVGILAVSLLFVVNGAGSIRWMQDPAFDLYAVRTATLKTQYHPGDQVWLAEPWINRFYLGLADIPALPDSLSPPPLLPGQRRWIMPGETVHDLHCTDCQTDTVWHNGGYLISQQLPDPDSF
ncbi:MAG: hypothetical protein SF053_13760 [Bacteroidia bacterium]|nr:hypothetical protein [Bacteroidia bacterium]